MSVRVSRDKKRGWIEVDMRVRLPDGTRHREKLKSPVQTLSGAARWAEERVRHLALHGLPQEADNPKEVPTLAEFKTTFMNDHVKANKLKPSTANTYEYRLSKHLIPVLGKKRLDEIGKAEVQKVKAHLAEHDPKSINNTLGVLSKLLNAAVDWDVIAVAPRIKKLRAPGKTYPFYDFEEYERVVEAAEAVDARKRVVVLLGGEAGLRRGEIAALEWADVVFKRNVIVVERTLWQGHVTSPKGGRARTVPMTKRLAAALQELRHLRGARVFYGDDGEPITEGTVNEWMEPVLKRAGFAATRRVHILRHTFCSHLAMRGAPPRAIQELAGHTDLTTTMRYMHLSPGSLQQAIGLLDVRGDGGETGGSREVKPNKNM